MTLLGRFSLRTKIAVFLACSMLAVLTVLIGGMTMRSRLMAHRAAQLEAVVGSAMSVAQSLESEVEAGKLTRAQANTRLAGLARHSHFAIITDSALPRGRALWNKIVAILDGRDAALLKHGLPHTATAVPNTGVAYVARFRPLGIIFLAGARIDNPNHSGLNSMENLALAVAIVIAAAVIAILVNRGSRGSFAQSDVERAAPGQGRHDGEIAAMSAPLEQPRKAGAGQPAVEAVLASAEASTAPERAQQSCAAGYDQLCGGDNAAFDNVRAALAELVSNTAELRANPETITPAAGEVGSPNEQQAARLEEAAAMMGRRAEAIRQLRHSILYTRAMPGRAAGPVRTEQDARRVAWDSETGRALAETAVQVAGLDAILNPIATFAKDRATGPSDVNSAFGARHAFTRQNATVLERHADVSRAPVAQSGRLVDLAKPFPAESANPARDPVAGVRAAPSSPVPPGSIRPRPAAVRPVLTNASATKPAPAGLVQPSWPHRSTAPLFCQAVTPGNDWQEF